MQRMTFKRREVLRHLTKTNKEIAERLNLTQHTVSRRVVDIFNILGADNKAEALIKAVKLNYITLDEIIME